MRDARPRTGFKQRRPWPASVLIGTLALLGSMAVLVAAAMALALQSAPSVVLAVEPDHADVARAITLLRQQDPRRMPNGTVHALAFSERDLELLMNHAGAHWLRATSQVRLGPGRAELRASVRAPGNPFGRWLNLQATLVQADGLPRLERLRLGNLPVPTWLAERAGLCLAARSGLQDELLKAMTAVQQVAFTPQQLRLNFVWRGGGESRRLLAAFVPADDQRRLRIYTVHLAQLTEQIAASENGRVSLTSLLAPMFELARQRSEAADAGAHPAADENRAALLVLTLLAINRNMDTVLPDARDWPRPTPLHPTLLQRDDLAQHLLVSAVIAAEGTSPLSRAVGIYKEVADSRGGSGFSFDDIAADRAGTRLGMLAVEEPRRLQRALAGGVVEADILPRVDDLPSNMPEPEFLRRFGGVDQPAYRLMIERIDLRVDALPVWSKGLATALR